MLNSKINMLALVSILGIFIQDAQSMDVPPACNLKLCLRVVKQRYEDHQRLLAEISSAPGDTNDEKEENRKYWEEDFEARILGTAQQCHCTVDQCNVRKALEYARARKKEIAERKAQAAK
ncbi:MAG: hypothetical protein K2Y18_05725 [Alphaproteobacteria bacterium]|nr:hypothetical protein [Alphaproteobacteria bacterium]